MRGMSRGPIRVLYVVASGQVIGGIEVNLLDIIDNTAGTGLETAGVLVPGEGKYTEMLRQRNIPVRMIDYYGWRWASPWRYVQTYVQLLSHIHCMQPDVVHVTHQWLAEYAGGLKRLIRQPVVCDWTNLEDEVFIRERDKYLARLDCVIVRSRAIENNLHQHNRRRIVTSLIPNGIETARFIHVEAHTDLKRELGLAPTTPLVGFVGRLVPWKGVEDLLAAWRTIQAVCSEARLVIVGEDDKNGEYLTYLKRCTEEWGIAHSVVFLGFRTDIDTIMHDLDVFVLPSHNEPFGIVTVEAMASGCLIVGTDGGGTSEIVQHGETGYLVPVGQPKALAEGIKWALSLSTEKARSIQSAAQRRAQEHFDISVQLRAQIKLYQRLCQKKSAAY